MKKINYKIYLSAVVSFCMLFSACEKETLTQFDSPPAVNFDIVLGQGTGFRTYTSSYTFLINPDDEHIHEVDVSIMGVAADYDRYFNVEVVADSNTTAAPGDYEIIGGVVPAGEYKGKLKIRLFKTPELQIETKSLKVRLVDSDDFRVGNREASEFTVSWTNRAVPPAINVYVRTFVIANWSTKAYSIFTQTTGRLNILAADYSSMGEAGVIALATKFGDYIKQWNLDHPNDPLIHDDGPLVGQPINPINYTRSKYN